MSRSKTCRLGLLALVLFVACASFNPTAAPLSTLTAVPVATRISLPSATTSAPRATVPARLGIFQLASAENSGVSGTFSARDNGDGTTRLQLQLENEADSNPWGLLVVDSCGTPVPENQRSIIDLPDIENAQKEETVETSAYVNHPGNLIVVVYGVGADGIPRIVACANLGAPAASAVHVTPTSTQDCGAFSSVPLEGSWLAYSATQNNNTDIYIVRVTEQGADAATVKRLTTDPAADFDPTWSPDGTRIAFRTRRDGNDEIYVMNADGSCQTNLTRDAVSDWSPAWSPDGTRIAFARFFDGNPYNDLAVVNADGSGVKRLTTASGEYPAWSPDGTRIAFATARDGNYEIYVMNADGTKQLRLTNNPAYDMSPTWSPDGTRIAYDTQRDHVPPKEVGIGPEFEIHVMNDDGSGDIQLTNNTQEDRFPAWAPNERIAFTRNGALFVVNADGSNPVQLLPSGSFAAWRPSRAAVVTPSASQTVNPNRVLARIPLAWKPTLLASCEGYLWVVSREEHTVARLDPKTNQFVGEPVRLAEPIYDIVAGEGGVWVSGDTTVTRLDPQTGQVIATLRGDQFGDGTPFRMTEGNGWVWVVNLEEAQRGSHVYRIDPKTNQYIGEPATVGVESLGIAFGAGSLWSADHDANTVSRVDPKTNQRIATIPISSEPHYIFYSPEGQHIWVANYHSNAVTRVDPRTNQVVGQPLHLPFAPEWITSANGKVWVLPSPTIETHLQGIQGIAEFDLKRLDKPDILMLEGLPMDAEFVEGALWVTVQSPSAILKLSP